MHKIHSSYFKTISVDYFGKHNDVEVFVNPSPSDIKSIIETTGANYLRFIADPVHKKLYVWNGNLGLHLRTAQALNLSNIEMITDLYSNYLCGDARIRGHYLALEGIYGPPRRTNDPEWDWVKKYFREFILSEVSSELCLVKALYKKDKQLALKVKALFYKNVSVPMTHDLTFKQLLKKIKITHYIEESKNGTKKKKFNRIIT